MNAKASVQYTPSLREGVKLQLEKGGHRENGQVAVMLRALPNPSLNPQHQWYDVRFENGVYGRFLERYLRSAEESGQREPLQKAEPAA